MQNTDKELLELAAKAAGVEGEWVENSLLDDYYKLPTTGILMWSEGRRHVWNPITSSGDALRLAVKVGIHITNSYQDAWASTLAFTAIEPLGIDPYAATRRAIVRVAAEIGKVL